ncbi:MAG: MarR family transcriptional regulator [Pseudomonadales bacterium]|nr:MarR family transcriptional regulator [Pseudomonadales bacterium]
MTEDTIAQLGHLALGSRLKRIVDRLMQDGVLIYRDSGTDFQPRWFPLFYALAEHGPDSVTRLANKLGVSHPSVNQTATEMKKAGLIATYKDSRDRRRRVLALTTQGKSLVPLLKPVWNRIERSLTGLVEEAAPDLLQALSALEAALERQSFYQRYVSSAPVTNIRIIGWAPERADSFAALNKEWISQYFTIEPTDLLALENPEAYIIGPGGEILFAEQVDTGEIIGTCALIPRGENRGELAKMGVTSSARGTGAGRKLMDMALTVARKLGWQVLYLETNDRLRPALSLYRQAGFIELPFPWRSDYARANVYMERKL